MSSSKRKRRNPDKKTRNLERHGNDDRQLAIEKLRAGIPVEPLAISETHERWYTTFNFSDRRIEVEWWFEFTERAEQKSEIYYNWRPDPDDYYLSVAFRIYSTHGAIEPWPRESDPTKKSHYIKIQLDSEPAADINVNKIFQYPVVMEKLYEALITSPLPRLRNPDEKIRRLEREGKDELQIAIENLRAGIPIWPSDEPTIITYPARNERENDLHEYKVTFKFSDRRIELIYAEYDKQKIYITCTVWGKGTLILPWKITIPNYEDYLKKNAKGRLKYREKDSQTVAFDLENTSSNRITPWKDPKVMEVLYQALVAPTKPILTKSNPDERIRRLERDQRPEKDVQLAIEKLRAGIPLAPDEGDITETLVDDITYQQINYKIGDKEITISGAGAWSSAEFGFMTVEIKVENAYPWLNYNGHPISFKFASLTRRPSLELWQYPAVMEAMYEALITPPGQPKKPKRNPDKKIRRIEREGQDDLQTAIENLRAGIPVNPNREISTIPPGPSAWGPPSTWETKYRFSDRTVKLIWGAIILQPPPESSIAIKLTALESTPWILEDNKASYFIYLSIPLTEEYLISPWKHPTVMQNLYQAFVEPINRTNPDEKIRRLERYDDKNDVQLAIEKLRAGIPIMPTTKLEEVYSIHWDRSFRIYYRLSDRDIGLQWEAPFKLSVGFDTRPIFIEVYVSDRNRDNQIKPWKDLLPKTNEQGLTVWPPKFEEQNSNKRIFEIPNTVLNRTHPWEDPAVMQVLYQALIEPIRPLNKNPDKRLRRLERDNTDPIQTAIAQLRAGIPIEPTEVFTNESLNLSFEIGVRTINISYGYNSMSWAVRPRQDEVVMFNINVLGDGARPWTGTFVLDDNQQPEKRNYTHFRVIADEAHQDLQIWEYPEVMNHIYQALITPGSSEQ